jgi:hypothetical protein
MYARFPKWEVTQRLAWNNLDATSAGSPTLGWNLWTLSELLRLADVDLSAGANASVWAAGADLVMTLELDWCAKHPHPPPHLHRHADPCDARLAVTWTSASRTWMC